MWKTLCLIAAVLGGLGVVVLAQDARKKSSSYMPVDQTEAFATVLDRMKAAKPDVAKKHAALLAERYDLSDSPAKGVAMSRGKRVQQGTRAKLPKGMTWEKLAALSPEEIREKGLFPVGYLPLPHPNHPEGGMVFPKFHIEEVKKQEARDLTRFDLDFDLPDHFLPEFPPPMYLTTRLDLGDVSKGKLVTIDNYFELFNGILNPKQLEGLRLLVTPFAQQQFNLTADRRSERPSRGVTCFDCHANGHTNGATHLVGDIRPQEFRHRIDTPTLRGWNGPEFWSRGYGSSGSSNCSGWRSDSRAALSTPLSEHRWGHVPQRTVGSLLVVSPPPLFQHHLRLLLTAEQLPVEQLIPQATVK